MDRRPTLIVMAKAPRVGVGKSRLAREVGSVEAWRMNRAMQRRTMREACDPRWRTLLCVAPHSALGLSLPGVWPPGILRLPQSSGDLGARLADAMAPYRNVAVVGADCPELTRAHIGAAFTALRRMRFALGMTHDGGFWILAAREGRAAARATASVRWSSKHAAADVLANLGAEQVSQVASLGDVDTYADWRRYRSAVRASSGV